MGGRTLRRHCRTQWEKKTVTIPTLNRTLKNKGAVYATIMVLSRKKMVTGHFFRFGLESGVKFKANQIQKIPPLQLRMFKESSDDEGPYGRNE
jgi:hypothetical protein